MKQDSCQFAVLKKAQMNQGEPGDGSQKRSANRCFLDQTARTSARFCAITASATEGVTTFRNRPFGFLDCDFRSRAVFRRHEQRGADRK
jgi:hypothetical protein